MKGVVEVTNDVRGIIMRSSLFPTIQKMPKTLFISISIAIHALVIFGLVLIFFPRNIQKESTTPISVTLVNGDKKQPPAAITSELLVSEPLVSEPLVSKPLVSKPVISTPLAAGLVATKPIPTKSSILKEILDAPVAPIIDSQKTIQISEVGSDQYSISSLTKKTRQELTAAEVLSTNLQIDRLEQTRQLVLDLTVDEIDKFDPIYMQAFRPELQSNVLSLGSTLTTYPIGPDLTKVVFAYSNGTQLCAEFTETDPLDAFNTSVWRTWLIDCN